MSNPKALFFNEDASNPYIFRVFSPAVENCLTELVELEHRIYTPADLGCEALKNAQYLYSTWGMPKLTAEQIRENLPRLKAVFYGAGSVQDFARPFLDCGIAVHSAWAANAVPVVEYTVAQIILANKGFFQSVSHGDTADYHAPREAVWWMPGNFNAPVGIIGCGMIGSMVCERLRQYRVDVLVSDPFASDEKLERLGAKRASLEEIFSTCQTISNHTANLPATVGMMTYKHFSAMKHNAVFINTGRGAQLVEADLIRALQEDTSRCAVLDVTMPEPPVKDSPLWHMHNVFLTPHIAGSLGNEIERMGEYMAQETKEVFSGEIGKYNVTAKMLETMA